MKKFASTFWVLLLVVGLIPLSGVAALATSHYSQSPQGDWLGVHGAAGYALLSWNASAGDEVSLPAGTSLTVDQGNNHRWTADAGTDVRVLQAPDGTSPRRAAARWHSTAVQMSLDFEDAFSGDVSVYMVDYNATTRRQTVTVDDGTTSTVVPIDAEFSQGAWVTAPVAVAAGGSVSITVANDNLSGNVVVSGVFLDGGFSLSAPQDLVATAGDAQVDLAWSAPEHTGGETIIGYNVYSGTTSGSLTLIDPDLDPATPTTAGLAYSDTTVTNGTEYFYAVAAVTDTPSEGPQSAEATATPVAPGEGPAWSQAPQGDWLGVHGAAGYALLSWNASAGDEVSLPAGTSMTVVAGNNHQWSPDAGTDVRVLQAPDGTSPRRAAARWHSTAVQMSLDFEDAFSGDVSVYMVDYNATTRRQTVTVDDGTTSTVVPIDAEFSQGAWVTAPVAVAAGGSVSITVANDNLSGNVVVSGVFLDGGFSLSAPQDLVATAGDAQVDLAWSAPEHTGGETITGYNVYRGTATGSLSLLGVEPTTATTSYTDTTVTNGTPYHYAVAAVTDTPSEGPQSAEATATPVAPGEGPAWSQAPQGDWLGVHGAAGYALLSWNASAGDEVSLPAGTSMTVVAGNNHQWSPDAGTDVRVLQAPDGTSPRRAAARWHSTAVQMSLDFEDAFSGDVSVYMVDYNATTRRQTVTVDDGTTSTVVPIDAEFSQGAWVTAPVAVAAGGSVSITVANDNLSGNVVVSGVFLDGGFSLSAPQDLVATAGDAQVDLAWSAPEHTGGETITGYNVYRGTATGSLSLLGVEPTTATTSYTDTTVTNGTEYFYAVAAVTDTPSEGPQSAEATATPVAPGEGPAWSQAPQGDWLGVHGAAGYALLSWNASAGDEVSLPAGTSLTVDQGNNHRWTADAGTDVRVLQAPDGTSPRRAAARWHSTAVQMSLDFEDAFSGDVSVYMVDYNATTRRQTVTVDDGTTSTVVPIDAEFSQGAWVTAPVAVAAGGSVSITVANDNLSGNVVVSGVFLDGGFSLSAPQDLVATAGDAQVDLAWSAPEHTGGETIIGYNVYSGTTSGSLTLIDPDLDPATPTTAGLAYSDTTVTNGTEYFYAVAAVTDTPSEGPQSAEATATPVAPGEGPAWSQAPQGDWLGVHGAAGYALLSWNASAGDEVSLPAGTSLTVDQGNNHRWTADAGTDVRVLQAPDGTSPRRAAARWHSTAVQMSLDFEDAFSGDVSVYMVDYNATTRRQTVTVDDGTTSTVVPIDAEFSQGAWVTAPVAVAAGGSVSITVANDNLSGNVVVSGVFLDGGFSLSAPQDLVATAGDAQVDLAWSAPEHTGGETIIGYNVYSGTTSGSLTLIDPDLDPATPTTAGLAYSDTTVTNGTEYFYAVAAVTDTPSEGPQSAEATATPVAPGEGPAWSQAPQGDWLGVHGAAGYALLSWNASAGDEVSLPAGTSMTVVAGNNHQWSPDAGTDVRALQAPDGTSPRRAAARWHETTTELSLDFEDAFDGSVSVYMVDYNSTGRRQTLTVDDGTTAATVVPIDADFSQGAWVTAPVTVAAGGSVSITAANDNLSGNAVVSGVFLDGVFTLSAPQDLVTTAGDAQVDLAWSAPEHTGGETITGYNVYSGTTSGSLTLIDPDSDPTTPTTAGLAYSDTGLTNGTPYHYAVAAVTDTPSEGPKSAEATATPVAPGDVDSDGDTYTPNQGDCNDANADVNPGATEIANGIDDNCDGTTDEGTRLESASLEFGKMRVAEEQLGTVTLDGPAVPGGVTVSLVTDPAVATVPANVEVPEGQTSATFTVTGVTEGSTNVEAQLDLQQIPVPLTVVAAGAPSTLTSLAIEDETPTVDVDTNGVVTLDMPAPAGGTTVTLSSSDTNVATTPVSVTVPAGETSAAFLIDALSAGSTTITATLDTVSFEIIITVS